MMRTLWQMMCFLAVVNLLALAIFVGWLWQSGRLSVDRMHALRELFAPTVAQAADAAMETEQAENEANQALTDQLRRENPAQSTDEHLMEVSLIKRREHQSMRRLEEEQTRLLAQLEEKQKQLDEERAAIDALHEQWLNATEAERERKTDEQFGQTVRLYESLAPRLAKQMLMQLVGSEGIEQAVAYIDAMNPRSASRIIGQLKTATEQQLAKDLLERLRTFGIAPQVDGVTSRADNAANTTDAANAG